MFKTAAIIAAALALATAVIAAGYIRATHRRPIGA
jgi:hypothetical protein